MAEFSTTYTTVPPVDKKLTDIINDLLQSRLPKTKLDELETKYPRPENYQSLVARKINEMVWQKLKPDTRAIDGTVQRCQKLFISALHAITEACTAGTDEIHTVRTHALVSSLPITTELFGDNLTKEIEDVTNANQLGNKLSSSQRDRRPRYHPYANSSSGHHNVAKENTGRVPSRKNFQFFPQQRIISAATRDQNQEQSNLTPATQVGSQKGIHVLLNPNLSINTRGKSG